MLAKATGNRKYLDWMNAFFWDVKRELFDEQEGLFYRDRTYIGQRTPNGKKVFWSRGNGWVFASFPRILDNLAADDPERARYEALFRTMAAALVRRQPDSGLWHPNLEDPKDLPMPESSGTGFFCYGLAWGRAPRASGRGPVPAGRLARLGGPGRRLDARGDGAMGASRSTPSPGRSSGATPTNT